MKIGDSLGYVFIFYLKLLIVFASYYLSKSTGLSLGKDVFKPASIKEKIKVFIEITLTIAFASYMFSFFRQGDENEYEQYNLALKVFLILIIAAYFGLFDAFSIDTNSSPKERALKKKENTDENP